MKCCRSKESNKDLKKVCNVRPTHSMILVEILTAQELLCSTLVLEEKDVDYRRPNQDLPPLQGIVLGTGPEYKGNVEVGNRVLILNQSHMPVMNYDESPRRKFLVEPHCVKGIID